MKTCPKPSAPWRARVVSFLAVLLVVPPALAAAAGWTRDDAAHLLRRAAFGGTPQQVDRLHAYGRRAAVEYLITGKVPPGREPVFDVAELPPLTFDDKPEDRQERQRQARQDMGRVRSWWLDRMIATDRPLEERMTLFWHGLFCSGFREVRDAELMYRQNELFRSHAFGNYRQLAAAVVRDPAMLLYLNAEQNVRGRPNENLARELMELFTMGEGNGYTEKDVAEVARCLTGAAVNRRTGAYVFNRGRHDPGEKVVFGRRGNFGPGDVVDLIFGRPEPARYLARRLWVFFASPEPSPAELAPLVEALRRSGYDVPAALRALFDSDAFYAESCRFALIRGPAELMVATVRNLETDPGPVAGKAMLAALDVMGQELFQPPSVRGWPGGENWITSATLFARYNACSALVMGVGRANRPAARGAAAGGGKGAGGAKGGGGAGATGAGVAAAEPAKLFPQFRGPVAPAELVDAAVARFLQRPLHDVKRAALIETLGTAPLRLGTPAADGRVRQMIALLLSTPEYQVH